MSKLVKSVLIISSNLDGFDILRGRIFTGWMYVLHGTVLHQISHLDIARLEHESVGYRTIPNTTSAMILFRKKSTPTRNIYLMQMHLESYIYVYPSVTILRVLNFTYFNLSCQLIYILAETKRSLRM